MHWWLRWCRHVKQYKRVNARGHEVNKRNKNRPTSRIHTHVNHLQVPAHTHAPQLLTTLEGGVECLARSRLWADAARDRRFEWGCCDLC